MKAAPLTSRTWAAAAFVGWLPLVATNAVFVQHVHGQLGVQERALHHLYDAGQIVGLAAGSSLSVYALWRLPLAPRLATGLALAFTAHYVLLAADLQSFIARHPGSVPWRALFALASTAALAGAVALGWTVSRGPWRWLGIGFGVVLSIANHVVLVLDYPGTHFILAWVAAALIASSAHRWVAERKFPRGVRASLVAAAALALLSYVIVPGQVVRSALLGSSGAVAAPYVARAWAQLRGGAGASVREHDPAWFKPRWRVPPIPAEVLPGAPRAPIVILLTIDALRPDVLEAREYQRVSPNFRAMAKNSLRFSRVWSPAAYTLASLRAIFHGTHYSQATGRAKSSDPGPEPLSLSLALAAGGVHTVNLLTSRGLSIKRGITAGFREEVYVGLRAPSENVVAEVLKRLGTAPRGPLLLYSHIFDPHSPYNRGGKKASLKESYAAEVAFVDAAIGTLRSELRRRKLDTTTYLIVTSDHGEAFNEHGRYHHSTTVYEEMIRVPLYIEGPAVRPRRVNRAASVHDVGPTVLSLFGLPTPGHFMGQSLVPFMRGENPEFSRPIAVDGGRNIRAMLFQNRWKAIVDMAHGTEELYDLKTDPGELKNLAERAEARAYFATLYAFFDGMNAK